MKIIIPVLGFGRAGGYRVLSNLANEWIKQGHDIDFLCPDSSDEPYFPTEARVVWVDGAGNISTKRAAIEKPSGWYHLKSLYRGLKIIGKKYDVIFANHSLTAWPVSLASCDKAMKVYYVQAYEPEYYANAKTIRGYLLAAVSALSYHLPLKRIVNAPIYFRYKNLSASQFVPPGIDLAIFRPLDTDNKIGDAKTIVIGCIGRCEPEKGTIFALRAFQEVYKIDSRFRLRVAYGNLPVNWEHKQCETVVPKNDEELANYYRSLDILIAPGTVQHGAPHYPVLEAGACGVAVITTGYMGASPKTAWIVKNKDVISIVDSISQIVCDDNERIKRTAAFLNVTQEFSWEYVSEKMLKIFKQKR